MRCTWILSIAALISLTHATYSVLISDVPGMWKKEPDEAPNCDKWAEGVDYMNCQFFAAFVGVKLPDLLAWNPSLARDCLGLRYDWGVCIRTRGPTCTQPPILAPQTCYTIAETTSDP